MDNRLIQLGLDKVCRACLCDENDMKSMFVKENAESEQIWKKYEQISTLEINENDGLPPLICVSCEIRLNAAYEFQKQCHKSFLSLKKYIDNSLLPSTYKEEFIEDQNTQETICVENFDFNDSETNVKVELNEEKLDSDDEDTVLVEKQEEKYDLYDPHVVYQAVSESKKKCNEKRECRLCGFVASNARGFSLHITHLHRELKDRWCTVCFKEVDDLQTHSKDHVNEKPYNCPFCSKGFTTQGHLTQHILNHSNDKPYKCKTCDKGFLNARHLRTHERIHSGEKPFVCSYCGRSFTQSGGLQCHIRTHTGLKPYECQVCESKYTTSSALVAHRGRTGHGQENGIKNRIKIKDNLEMNINANNVIENNVMVSSEDIGTNIDESSNEVANNEDLVTPKENNKLLCNVCGKTFNKNSKLRLHMRIHTGETPYKCTYCDKRFSTRGTMVVHVRSHTGEKPHVCHVCGKGFVQTSVLNTHMKLHTGKPEQCYVCHQRFCRPAELRLHMRKHTGEKPYLCTECGQAFIQRSHLMEHIKTHSDERPYKCDICERGFKQSSSLKSHIKIHTGHKPFKCSVCAYSCRQSYALTQHMRQHQDDFPRPDRPHECIICHKTFTTNAMLTSHAKSVHNAVF